MAVGTSGSSVSNIDGTQWKPLDRENYNSVAFTSTGGRLGGRSEGPHRQVRA